LPRLSHPSARLALKPRGPAHPVAPPDEVAGCPASSILRPCRRSIFESPRISYPSALLELKPGVSSEASLSSCACRCTPQVALLPASSDFAGDQSHESPRGSYPSALLALMLRVAPRPRASSHASQWVDEFPRASTFRLCLGFDSSGRPSVSLPRRRLMVPQVTSGPAPSGFAVPASSGFPESRIYGWVDNDFPVLLELCILGRAADESS
jgi:hypothetical protein